MHGEHTPAALGTAAVWGVFAAVLAGCVWLTDAAPWLLALLAAIALVFDPFFFVRLPLAAVLAWLRGPRLAIHEWYVCRHDRMLILLLYGALRNVGGAILKRRSPGRSDLPSLVAPRDLDSLWHMNNARVCRKEWCALANLGQPL
jgi:hypothetical protein